MCSFIFNGYTKQTKVLELGSDRRLYEYTLYAVCSPLQVIEAGITSDQTAAHVAKLFNVDPEEHEEKYIQAVKTQPCAVVLSVDVKRARDLPGEDQNGFSDPYCKVSVVYTPSNPDDSNGLPSSTLTVPRPSSPSQIKQNPSLFSCISSQSSTTRLKPSIFSRRNSGRRSSRGRLSIVSSDKRKSLSTISYRTEVRPKTVNPEWNEHFEFEIDNIYEQYLLIAVFDSDRDQVPGVKTVVQQKRGVAHTIRGIRVLLKTGQIDDDFLGQVMLDIKSLLTLDREQWFPLTGPNRSRSSSSKLRGEILLGLKVHFKLHENVTQLVESLYPLRSPPISKDDKNAKGHRASLNGNAIQFPRRHSTLTSTDQPRPSIILRSSTFRKHFRPASVQVRDYRKTSFFEDHQTHMSQSDSGLIPTGESDLPLLIEEYHQLCRIVMLHQLEDVRETSKEPAVDLVTWDGSLSELSYSVLMQFRVLYNIPILSESFIQLLVVMELRCSEDYASMISHGVIEAFLKIFMDKVRQRLDINDLDFTDYEKTAFKDIFQLFIGHYKQRVVNDGPWFIPSKEVLPTIKSIFDTIYALLQLKICSNETAMKIYLEETIRTRLQNDISDSFNAHPFAFNDTDDIQLNNVRKFLEYVKKLADSMSVIKEYNQLFTTFNTSYIKICFFESDSAGDHLSELTKCLLTNMTDSFQTYSKPMVKGTSSIYDPNLIQSSNILLSLYSQLQTIVTALRDNLETRDWAMNAFRLKLIEYRQWFAPTMKFLLEGFVASIRQAMERAVEDDSDAIPDEDIVLYSQSSVAATSLCIKLCREWESVDYPDVNIRYTALIKLTNTICEQCQHYARRTARKLSENKYFTDLNRTRSFNVSKKLCMLVNDIEYVKRNILSSLPKLLNFSSVLEKMAENYESISFEKTKLTLERLISTAEHEMTDVIKLIFEHVATCVHVSLQSKISNYYQYEKRGKVDCMKDVNRYIDQEILEKLYKGLEAVQYSRVACAIRIKTLQCLRELLPLQEPPDFYERVLTSFDELAANFEAVCCEDPQLPGPPCEEVTTFRRTLQTCAFTTQELQLAYFREASQIQSPHEYPMNNGEIIFRTGFEIASGLVTIHVIILGCRDLPKMDTFGTSDPYVVLELLPYTFYHKQAKEFRTVIQKQTLNPEYNETFLWHRLPLSVLQERGAVLHLSVWDQDYVNDDFIGECFVPIPNITPLKNLASLRDVPVSEVRLRRPHKNMQPRVFELIRNRASFDTQAAVFLKQRTAVMQSGNDSDRASIMSDDRNSTGSYASTALRSLLCMLPFNLRFGHESTAHDRSDVADDEELI